MTPTELQELCNQIPAAIEEVKALKVRAEQAEAEVTRLRALLDKATDGNIRVNALLARTQEALRQALPYVE